MTRLEDLVCSKKDGKKNTVITVIKINYYLFLEYVLSYNVYDELLLTFSVYLIHDVPIH